jgi:hypothetical protein
VTRRARRLLALIAVLALAAAAAWMLLRGRDAPDATTPTELAVDSLALAPPGVRVRVEVLNASRRRGLARRATMYLRDLGYDVVANGNASEQRERSLVLQRAGEAEWAARVGRAVGGAAVEARPDSSRHVDVTVLLGRDWQPPPGPLRP